MGCHSTLTALLLTIFCLRVTVSHANSTMVPFEVPGISTTSQDNSETTVPPPYPSINTTSQDNPETTVPPPYPSINTTSQDNPETTVPPPYPSINTTSQDNPETTVPPPHPSINTTSQDNSESTVLPPYPSINTTSQDNSETTVPPPHPSINTTSQDNPETTVPPPHPSISTTSQDNPETTVPPPHPSINTTSQDNPETTVPPPYPSINTTSQDNPETTVPPPHPSINTTSQDNPETTGPPRNTYSTPQLLEDRRYKTLLEAVEETQTMMVNQTRLIENLVDASADRDSRDKQTIGQCLGDVKTLYTQLQEGETLLRVLQEEYNTTSEERERLAEHNSRLKEKNRQIEAALNDTIKRTRTSGAVDCQDVLTMGFTKSDVYTIYPRPPGTNVTVYCDQETDRGGWTVFLTRDSSLTPHLAFNRSWQEYAQGFGDLTGDHWLGNKALHFITGGSDYIMRIDVKNTDGEEAFAEWGSFSVSSEEEKYRLNVRMYNPNSTLDDVFAYSNFMFFSTHDQDNDPKPQGSCSNEIGGGGGWWWKSCSYIYPTRPFSELGDSFDGPSTCCWLEDHEYTPLAYIQLKIRPWM